MRFLTPARPTADSGFLYRSGWWLSRIIVWFVALSLGITVLYRFVPVPITITMISDPNGFEKDWTPLSRIDRNMVAAVIAGEDAKFCTHQGFDQEAIAQAIERNQRGGKLRGGSTISQQTAKNAFLWPGRTYIRKGLEAGATGGSTHISSATVALSATAPLWFTVVLLLASMALLRLVPLPRRGPEPHPVTLRQDLRFALRSFAKSPGFAAAAIVSRQIDSR